MFVHRLAIALLLLPGAVALAQSQSSSSGQTNRAPRNYDNAGAEVFGGFTYLHSGSVYRTDLPSGPGFNFGAGFDVYRPVWFVAKISLFRFSPGNGSHPNENTFLFGPEVAIPVPKSSKLVPFAGFLIGGSTYSNSGTLRDGFVYINNSSFAFDFEGGVDYRMTPCLALRGAIGYLHSTLEEYGQPIPGSTPRQSAGYGREQIDIDVLYRF